MINPPISETKHSTMQLNMGEGKTSCIVPILAAVLSNEQHVCQVTVLKSLFSTNLKSLRQYLGGMLGRRVYVFPCHRKLKISDHIDGMLEIYKECKQIRGKSILNYEQTAIRQFFSIFLLKSGVIMSLPEYQLSFQLKISEAIYKDQPKIAEQFLTVQKWLDANVRGVFDESDAILQPKYQLIYTVGSQLSVDGGIQRWTVMQELLKRIPYHMKNLHNAYGPNVIEFDVEFLVHPRLTIDRMFSPHVAC